MAVEKRRTETQSPARKIYRRLRESQVSFWAIVVGLLLGLVVFVLAARFLWPALPWPSLLEFLLSLLLALLVGAALVAGMQRSALSRGAQLGPTLRHLEWQYNRFMGRDQPKAMYGEVNVEVAERVTGLGPTTAARVLLEREDKHRDEEASRQRVLRLIALVAGVFLAYLLQIDAAVLLDQAVPGVSRSINAILTVSPQQLNRFWAVLPDDNGLTAGIILTGLAASAGSAFWHDQLGKLQNVKEQSEAAAKALRRTRDLLDEED